MKKLIFFILLFIGLGKSYGKEQVIIDSTVILNSEKDLLLVSKQTSILEDKTGKLTIEDVLRIENQEKFQLLNKESFNHIPTKSTFWLKLTVQNRSGKEAWIELGSIYLWYVDFFRENNNQYIPITRTGSLRPKSNKAYPSNVFWLPLGANKEIQTVYIAIRTEGMIEIPIKVGSILSLTQEKIKSDYLVGGFVGLMLVMFAYNLFLLFATGDRVYLPYLGHILTSIFSTSYLNKYALLPLLFDESHQHLIYLYVPTWIGLPFVFVGYFSIKFLNLAQYQNSFKRIVQFNILIFGLLIPFINIFSIVPFYIQTIFYQIAAFSYIICLSYIGFNLCIFKKDKNAIFYMIGWIWTAVGLLCYLLYINGILPHHFLFQNAIFFGVSIEVLMFSLALANRINFLRKEKNKIQEENFKLIQEQNKKLEQKVAERISEINHYKELLEQTGRMAGIGAWEWDLPTQKIRWSAVTKEIHGVSADYEPAPALENGTTFYKKGESINKFGAATKQCAIDGTPFDLELQLITAQGKEIWIRVLGNAEFKNGQYVRMYGTFQDINARKTAEIETQEIKEKLSSIFNSISEVVWSVRLPDYKMILTTPSAVDMYGVAFEDLMNDNTYWEKAIHPEDRAIIKTIYEEIATKGSYYQEYRIITTKGEVKWISNHGKIIFDNNGTPTRLDGLISDISKRKQAEEALAEKHKLLRTIIDNIPINIYVKDLDFKKILANQSEYEYLNASSEAEVIGKIDSELYPEETAENSLKEDKFVIETGQPILGKETLSVRFGNRQCWFLTSKIPLKNQTGQIIGLVGISYNFTSRKQSEETLIQTLEELKAAQGILEQQAREIAILNNHLEILVEERTLQLSRRNTQLNEYAFFNAHKLRAPIATILGLYQVLDLDISAEEREIIIQKLQKSVILLDKMVHKSQSLLDEIKD